MSNAEGNYSPTPATKKPGSVAPIAWSSFRPVSAVRARRSVTTHTVLAPRRFDVHRIADIAAWLDQAEALGATKLIVDLSEVRFVDQAALEAIDMLLSNPTVAVECVTPSEAFSLTARLVSKTGALRHAASNLSLTPRSAGSDEETPVTVTVTGGLTVANVHVFRDKLAAIAADSDRRAMVIDLSAVAQLDAAGLVGVTSQVIEMRRQGRLVSIIEPRQTKAAQFAELTGVLPKLATPTC